MLNPLVFQKLTIIFGNPNIDLFATRLNKQLSTYASWLPDPGSKGFQTQILILWVNYFPYIFPPFSMIWPVTEKDDTAIGQSNNCSTIVANTNMIPCTIEDGYSGSSSNKQHGASTSRNIKDPSAQSKNEVNGNFMFQKYREAGKLSADTTEILSAAWKQNTTNKYAGIIKSYKDFCREKEIDHMQVDSIIQFLTKEFGRGL